MTLVTLTSHNIFYTIFLFFLVRIYYTFLICSVKKYAFDRVFDKEMAPTVLHHLYH